MNARILLCAMFLLMTNCGGVNTTASGCDDAATHVDAGDAEHPHTLTLTFTPPDDGENVREVSLILTSEARARAFTPFTPMRTHGVYEDMTIMVTGVQEEAVLNVFWLEDAVGKPFINRYLFVIDAENTYHFRGSIQAHDEEGNRWLAYPTPFEHSVGGMLRFVRAEACLPNYTLRNGICH